MIGYAIAYAVIGFVGSAIWKRCTRHELKTFYAIFWFLIPPYFLLWVIWTIISGDLDKD